MMAYRDQADAPTLEALEALMAQAGGGLAPFDPYLHWSLSRRSQFLPMQAAQVVREYLGGLFVVQSDGMFYIARRFMNTAGWHWACVPVVEAEPDTRMLQLMAEAGAA